MRNFLFFSLFLCSVLSKNLLATLEQESAVWVPTLDFTYGEKNFDDSEEWHENAMEFIKKAATVLESTESPNVAVARLRIVYTQAENILNLDIDLPHVFISGWCKNRLRRSSYHSDDQMIDLLKDTNRRSGSPYAKDPVFVGTANSKIKEKSDYCRHLQSIYKDDMPSAVTRIPETYAFLRDHVSPYLKNDEHDNSKRFFHRFHDTEQAIYLSIVSNAQEFIKVKQPVLPENCLINGFVLNIASYNDICFDCSDTGFRQSEAKRGFVESLGSYVFQKHPLNDDSPFFTFIEVSSFKPSIDLEARWNSRGAQTNFSRIYDDGGGVKEDFDLDVALIPDGFLSPEGFGSYVVQKNMNYLLEE